MTDYQCWPLWWNEAGESVGSINPSNLPLRKSTIERLLNWQHRYDRQLNLKEPSSSVRFSPKELQAFEDEGLTLWKVVAQELAGEFEVSYFSQTQQVLLPASDLSKWLSSH